MSGRDDYYDRQTVNILCQVEIAWKRGSEASRNDAMRHTANLHLQVVGASEHGCYSAKLRRVQMIEPETAESTVEIVRRRLADGRTIADADVHRLVAEIDRLRGPSADTRRWRHRKRGTVYEEIGRAELQIATCDVAEGSALVVYRGEDGKLWAREAGEFHDGRFEEITDGE